MIGYLIILLLVFVLGITLGAGAIEYDRVAKKIEKQDKEDRE